jgi:hypothetical protein
MLRVVMLRKGTLKCPKDKERLHFHQIQGIRLVREVGKNKLVYDAKCPKCGDYYEVRR